jgi:tripartite-type tricarboxylate transporter receptor subunit TctC
MQATRRAMLAGSFSGIAALAAPRPARAQAPYPDRPVRLIVPFTPGGAGDIVGRLLAAHLQAELGRAFVVENRPGAGSALGVEQIARATPDGYAIGMANIASHAILPNLRSLPYDPIKDFAPVGLVALTPCLLVVNPARLPVGSVAELVARAKAKPDELDFSSSGAGTSLHLGMEMFMQAAGIRMTHIPFNGSGPSLQALLAGQVGLSMEVAAVAWPQVQDGKLRALAVTTPARAAFAPDLPTLEESFPGTAIAPWHGLVAPAGTPQPIIARLAAATDSFLRQPETLERFRQQTLEPKGAPPAEFAAFIQTELATFREVIRRGNVSVN